MYQCLITSKVRLEHVKGVRMEVEQGGRGQRDQSLELWPRHTRRPLAWGARVWGQHSHGGKFRSG